MADYKLLSFISGGRARAGLLIGDRVHPAADLTGVAADDTVFAMLQDWAAAELRIQAAIAAGSQGGVAFGEVTLLAPLQQPVSVYCAGANYTDHVAEMAKANGLPPDPDPREAGLKPWHFIRPWPSMAAPGEAVPIPAGSVKLDWEVELAAVIGRAARNVSAADALDYVAGYTVADDVSARDLFARPPIARTAPFHWDWIAQKCNERSCPVGPWIVPAAAIGDPQALKIGLSLNGEPRQDSSTSQMIFPLAEQIAQLSAVLTLQPGDIILTGTPAGVGMGRGEFLKAGDRIEAWVEHVGTLVHTIGGQY